MVSELWTVRDVLQWTADRFGRAGIGSPRLDAEVLLAHALGCDRVGLYLDLDRPLGAEERARYRALVAARLERRPVAYLVGHREFWSRRFAVDPSVLVPRPETELLVEEALRGLEGLAAPRILELGTGSGAIAVTLAAERPDAEVVATDCSGAALAMAARNVGTHGVAVRLCEGDLFAALPPDEPPFHAIVANLPYVSPEDREGLAPELFFEPEGALFAEEGGLAVIRRAVAEARAHLVRPEGWIGLEVAAGQGEAVAALLTAAGAAAPPRVVLDLAGQQRVVAARL